MANITCQDTFQWNSSAIRSQQPILIVCILAAITHTLFWLQILVCSSLRQRSMQWLYTYLFIDLFLLTRYFVIYIIRTRSIGLHLSRSWQVFLCYAEGTVDNYLNTLEVYVLLALNLCRYFQIVYKRNVYVNDVPLLICAHLIIYLIPLFITIVEFLLGWARLIENNCDSCHVVYINIYVQLWNILIGFVLPILLNIYIIYRSMHGVDLLINRDRTRIHLSAREKYHRSLVLEFLFFYTVWLVLWSPAILVYQLASVRSTLTMIASLLSYIEICLDPIIVTALHVRFQQIWKTVWIYLNNRWMNRARIKPMKNDMKIRY
jgi:hypothetical protein